MRTAVEARLWRGDAHRTPSWQPEVMNNLSLILRTVTANEPEAMKWTFSVAESQAMFAQQAFDHFATCLASVDKDQMFFQGVYVHTRKVLGLGVLSALRQHRVESGQNLRQAVEATSLMGYHAMHPGVPEGMGGKDRSADVLLAANEAGRLASLRWVSKAHPGLSRDLKHYKDHINRSMSHATIMGTFAVFNYAANTDSDRGFFDVPHAEETRVALYLAGQVGMSALFMLGKVAKDAQGIHLQPGFDEAWDELVAMAISIRKGLAE